MDIKFPNMTKEDLKIARKVADLYNPEEIDFEVLTNFDTPRIRTVYRYIKDYFKNTEKYKKIRTLEIGYHIGLVVELLKILDERKQLDICATERFTPENWELIGTPRCPLDMLDLMNDEERSDFIDKKKGSFDCIVLGEVIEHIPGNYFSAIFSAMYSLLAEGGLLIVTTPNLHNLLFRISHLLGADYDKDAIPNHMGFPHINNCSLRKVVDFAHASRFLMVKSEYTNFGTGYIIAKSNSNLRKFIERLRVLTICKLIPSLSDDFIVSFEKTKSSSGRTSLFFGNNHVSFLESLRSRM